MQKAGKDATEPVSYRPISLLSNVSKVAEKLVHAQFIRHCLDNRIIPDEPVGSLKGRSVELQLLSNLTAWHEPSDKWNHVHCVLLDAAKACNHVDHSPLLLMLKSSGLDHVSLRWFFSYLSGRHIRTKVSNHLSSSSSITSAVPQGLVQSPRSSFSNLPQGYSICHFRSDCPLLLMIRCCTFHPNSNLASAVHSKLTWMPYCLGPLI